MAKNIYPNMPKPLYQRSNMLGNCQVLGVEKQADPGTPKYSPSPLLKQISPFLDHLNWPFTHAAVRPRELD